MYLNGIFQHISNLMGPLLVQRLEIYFTWKFERAVKAFNSHWFILQQLFRSFPLCNAHFCRSIRRFGELDLIPVSGDLSLYNPIFFFRYSLRLLISNRKALNTELMLINISGSQPVSRGHRGANWLSSTAGHAYQTSTWFLMLFSVTVCDEWNVK